MPGATAVLLSIVMAPLPNPLFIKLSFGAAQPLDAIGRYSSPRSRVV